jgi:hypothetical protein
LPVARFQPVIRALHVLAGIALEHKLADLVRLLKAYNPDQPRVPAGNPDGGQWTGANGGADAGFVQLAGDIPQNDTPNIPEDEPPGARLRNTAIKTIARAAAALDLLVGAPAWVARYADYIIAYNDPPKALDELRNAVSDPKRGYDIHHIVEQTSAEQDGYPRSLIDGRENLVRISTLKHWEINAWYQTPNARFNDLTPREYLRGAGWDVRTRIGLDALVRAGVLEP